jgi:hypothetical protein
MCVRSYVNFTLLSALVTDDEHPRFASFGFLDQMPFVDQDKLYC